MIPPPLTETFRTVLIEDDAVFRQLLVMTLEKAPDLHVVGHFALGRPGLEFCRREKPDLLVVDLSLPDSDGMEIVREVRRTSGIPTRTVNRWGTFWRRDFPRSRLFEEQRGRFLPPLATGSLPASLMERFEREGRDVQEVLVRTLAFLAPLTTGSVAGGAGFVRVG